MSRKAPDLQLKQAFADLHRRKSDTKHRLRFNEVQIYRLRRMKDIEQDVLNELKVWPSDSVVYDTVGRAFVRCDLSDSKKEVAEEVQYLNNRIGEIAENNVALKEGLAAQEQRIREMVKRKQKIATK